MTRDDVIYMARTAGLQRIYGACANDVGESSYEDWDYEIERFAELVAAASASEEREACAKVCEEIAVGDSYQGNYAGSSGCAKAIRARGQK